MNAQGTAMLTQAATPPQVPAAHAIDQQILGSLRGPVAQHLTFGADVVALVRSVASASAPGVQLGRLLSALTRAWAPLLAAGPFGQLRRSSVARAIARGHVAALLATDRFVRPEHAFAVAALPELGRAGVLAAIEAHARNVGAEAELANASVWAVSTATRLQHRAACDLAIAWGIGEVANTAFAARSQPCPSGLPSLLAIADVVASAVTGDSPDAVIARLGAAVGPHERASVREAILSVATLPAHLAPPAGAARPDPLATPTPPPPSLQATWLRVGGHVELEVRAAQPMGVVVKTQVAVPPGEVVRLRLTFADGERLDVSARVARCRLAATGYAAELELMGLVGDVRAKWDRTQSALAGTPGPVRKGATARLR